MNLQKLFTEDRAVSPVIGVILMVAITVILAAVIGAFVLGLGDQVSNNAPSASFEYNFNGIDDVAITHGGGDNIDIETLSISIGGEQVWNGGNNVSSNNFEYNQSSPTWEDTVQTGDTLRLAAEEDSENPTGETVRIIWSNPGGGSSNTLSDRTWP